MNAFHLFSDSLAQDPKRIAIVDGFGADRRDISFGRLGRRVDCVVHSLRAAGLAAGDRVLLAVPVSIETYTVMLALLKAGMVVMFIDPAHGASRVASILRRWPPAAIVATRPLLMLRFLVPELRRIPRRFVVNGHAAGATAIGFEQGTTKTARAEARSAADSALLTFTSGSTGEPKPVVRTHGFLKQQLQALRPVADHRCGEIDLVAMPMFVLFNLANGVSSVIPACDMKNPGRANPRLVAEQLLVEGATRMVASPALLERLARYCLRREICLPDLRTIATGGGPVSPALPGQLKRIAPAAVIRMVYGSTEAEPVAWLDDHELSVTAVRRIRQGGGLLVGKPAPGCNVAIVRTEPNAAVGPLTAAAFDGIACGVGDIGEIVVSGKHVLSGYADPERDADTKIDVDGTIWHRTGDAGYLDSSGRLWLVGRCSAAITDRHGSVYPFQVEYALAGLQGVRRVALTFHAGQRVLVLEPSGREFRTHCAAAAECISRHRIERIVTVRRIPVDKRHGAKVDYPALAGLLDDRWARIRLAAADIVSRVFRICRRRYRMLRVRACHPVDAATKVAE